MMTRRTLLSRLGALLALPLMPRLPGPRRTLTIAVEGEQAIDSLIASVEEHKATTNFVYSRVTVGGVPLVTPPITASEADGTLVFLGNGWTRCDVPAPVALPREG